MVDDNSEHTLNVLAGAKAWKKACHIGGIYELVYASADASLVLPLKHKPCRNFRTS